MVDGKFVPGAFACIWALAIWTMVVATGSVCLYFLDYQER